MSLRPFSTGAKWTAGFLVLSVLVVHGGIRPRAAAADYPAHTDAVEVSIGAAAVPAEQVRKIFAADLSRAGYVVIEVAIFPKAGARTEIRAADFMLRSGSGQAAVRPVSGRVVASAIDRKDNPPPGKQKDVAVYTTASVGYESGGAYDPSTGRRRGAVYTSAGVAVGSPPMAGPPPYPQAPGRDPALLEQDLWDESLPDGITSQPVSGYLYFPKVKGNQKHAESELTWYSPTGAVRLRIPPAGH